MTCIWTKSPIIAVFLRKNLQIIRIKPDLARSSHADSRKGNMTDHDASLVGEMNRGHVHSSKSGKRCFPSFPLELNNKEKKKDRDHTSRYLGNASNY